MRYLVAMAALVLGLGLLAAPALTDTVHWTGNVMAIQPEEQLFTLSTKGREIKLRLGPKATEELRMIYNQLRVGDNVKATGDDEDLLVTALKVLPPAPEAGAAPGPEMPQAETKDESY